MKKHPKHGYGGCAVSEVIKSIDMFGQPIELNFNNSGSKHKTVVGGFCSIYIRMFLLFYVVYIFHQMFSYGNDTVRNATFTLDSNRSSEQNVNNIPYSSMHAKLFMVFRWQL